MPAIDVDTIALAGERIVARALVDTLPNDCLVLHGNLQGHDGRPGSSSVDRPTDFVIVVPSSGCLLLRVESGRVMHDSATRGWSVEAPGQSRSIRDPFMQANQTMRDLQRKILATGVGGRTPPFHFGYAVIFPDLRIDTPGTAPAVALSANDLDRLGSRLLQVLQSWRQETPEPLTPADLETICDVVLTGFGLLRKLEPWRPSGERSFVRLTSEQRRVAAQLATRDRAAIEGIAGSGKTLLAIAQARRLARAGKSTLLCCYGKNVAETLAGMFSPREAERITVRHLHGLASEWCAAARIALDSADSLPDDFWRVQATDKFLTAIERLPRRFDAVIVDEGQDFHPVWWLPLQLINRRGEHGTLFVFYDPIENLYVKGKSPLPELGGPLRLATNCRNTRKIAGVCSDILDVDVDTHPDAAEGADPVFGNAASYEVQRQLVTARLNEWLHGELAPSQVAILSPNALASSSLRDVERLGEFPVTSSVGEWQTGKGVLVSTIRDFKGLESDAVLLIDVPDSEPGLASAEYYFGASRAKRLLAVQKTAGQSTNV